MTQNVLSCADVPLRNCSLRSSLTVMLLVKWSCLFESAAVAGFIEKTCWMCFENITVLFDGLQGLASLVLKPVEEADLSPMDTSISAVAPLLPSQHWLLVRLPSLPLFECIKMNICSDLRHVSRVDCIELCLVDNATSCAFLSTSYWICFLCFSRILQLFLKLICQRVVMQKSKTNLLISLMTWVLPLLYWAGEELWS